MIVKAKISGKVFTIELDDNEKEEERKTKRQRNKEKEVLVAEKKRLEKKSIVPPNAILNIISSNDLKNIDGVILLNLKVGLKLEDGSNITRTIEGGYSDNEGMYYINKNIYDEKLSKYELECILYKDGNLFKMKETKDSHPLVSYSINSSEKADFFVRTDFIKCIRDKHRIIDVKAVIPVADFNGMVIDKEINSYYCKDCNLYFIYNSTYANLKKVYVPLCQIYEYDKWIKELNNPIAFRQESYLHSFGYNVGKNDNLTKKQRREVLNYVIENGFISKHEIITLLTHFIKLKENIKIQEDAIEKWRDDIDYLKNNNIYTQKSIKVNSIKIINNIKKK